MTKRAKAKDLAAARLNPLAVAYLPLADLLPYARNSRTHDDAQVAQIASSIREFGFTNPILVSPENDIIAGHGRALAAAKLGMAEVPCIRLGHLTETQRKAYVIADNRLALNAGWDAGMLKLELLDLKTADFGLDLLGFESKELEKLLAPAAEGNEGLTDPDAVPENAETRCEPGDLWILGKHRLLCGDSTNVQHVERLMGGAKADMVFTDPPYGVSYEKKCGEIANQSKTRKTSRIKDDDVTVDRLKEVIQAAFNNLNVVLAPKSAYYVCSPQGGELGLMMMMMQEANIPCRHMIIWVKNAPVFSMGRLDYDYQHEPILFGWSPNRTHHKSTQTGQWKSSVWSHAKEPNKLHPTMKPIALIENAITNSCPSTGRVIDLFCGSGSTLIACEKTGRSGHGMEIDPHYCDVILTRWEKFTGQQAKLEAQADG